MASLAEFLVERLENAGIKHVFGVPGDYILPFFAKLTESKKIELINTVGEEGAGFAADGYARVGGIGCVVVTYNVGALKLCNPIAGAYAERSPIIVISGAPGISERNEPLPHHVVGNFECQRHVFKNITCAQAVLDNPTTAGYEIDRVFEAMRYYKQPVYIEMPRDLSQQSISYDVYTQGTPKSPETDMVNLEDALHEVAAWLESAKNPVLLAGVEIARHGLGKKLLRFAEKYNIPIACTLLGKSVVNERHPLFIGVYAGSNSSHQYIRDMVEKSDCLLVCGEVITEATFGYRSSKAFQKRDMVTCTVDCLKVRNHQYNNVSIVDFFTSLFKTELTIKKQPQGFWRDNERYIPDQNNRLTVISLFKQINNAMDENTVIVADAGDALLGGADLLTVSEPESFFGPAFYLSMGFAIPAAIGIKFAKPKSRPFVIVGDGGFQMSVAELSTVIRWNLNPIIFVLNNGGYLTERKILNGKFNDLLNWNYHKVSDFMGGGNGAYVQTEGELAAAINLAAKSNTFSIINCVIQPDDASPALQRIGEALSRKTLNR